MGRLSAILQARSPVLWVFGPEQTVAEAVRAMAEHQVGVVPIMDQDRLIGIFSERVLLRRVVARGRSLDKTLLSEVMTPDPVTASPNDDRPSAMRKMRSVGCRHLPVVAEGALLDMLSMRDLLADEIEERTEEVRELRQYVSGSY